MELNTKEVYIKLQYIKEIVELLENIKYHQDTLNTLFSRVDSLSAQERQIFEQWTSQIEGLDERMEYLIL